jgi:hypothetical protein
MVVFLELEVVHIPMEEEDIRRKEYYLEQGNSTYMEPSVRTEG